MLDLFLLLIELASLAIQFIDYKNNNRAEDTVIIIIIIL